MIMRRHGDKRRARALGLLAVLVGILALLNLQTSVPEPVAVQVELRVEVEPERVLFYPTVAGGAALPAGLPLRLVLSTPAGPVVWAGQSDGGRLPINLPYVRAGQTPYTFTAGSQTLSGTFSKVPGPPVGVLKLKIGRRSARVTADSLPALMLHPLDAQENVTTMPVFMRAEGPTGDVWQRALAPRRLLAWSLLPTGGEPGTLKVAAVTGGVRGERAEVDLVAGIAAHLTLASDIASAPATGRDPWRLQLADATDMKGNLVTDGTAVTFVGGNDKLDFYLTRPLIQGGQPLLLPTYPQVGSYSLQAQSGQYTSEVVSLRAEALRTEGVLSRWVALDPLMLSVGPIVNLSGSLVDDGTAVTLKVLRAEEVLTETTRVLENGTLVWVLPPLPAGATSLESCVVGVCERLELPARAL